MKIDELRQVPLQVKNGFMSSEEAFKQVIAFIHENYPVFGLHKYDEDFREEIYLAFIEKGDKFITQYNSSSSDFFTYLYCNVVSLIHTKRKSLALHTVKEHLVFAEGIIMLDDLNRKYKCIGDCRFEAPKVPYSFQPIKLEYLQKIFSPVSSTNCDKKILVLALKSCFYLTDEMVEKVCKLYNLDVNAFYQSIQYCKASIQNKTIKHEKIMERRNYAYYHHKRYETQLNKMRNLELDIQNPDLEIVFTRRHDKHFNTWKTLNTKLKNGFLILRPTNKTISEVLGISERLVSYYLTCAKQDAN